MTCNSIPPSPTDELADLDKDKPVFIASIQYGDESFLIDLPEDNTIADMKEKLRIYTQLFPNEMRLIVKGHICQDAEPISSYTSEDNFTLVKTVPFSNVEKPSPSSTPSENPFDPSTIKMMSSMMKNPSFQTMKAFENPALQREMMRSQDLAMSNIEMLPEGFNALRRSYSTIQKPLLDAMDQSIAPTLSTIPSTGNHLASSRKINKEPIPNPWNPNPASKLSTTKFSTPTHKKSAIFLSKLADMKEMGFTDEEENARVLTLCDENLDMAINLLLASRGSEEKK